MKKKLSLPKLPKTPKLSGSKKTSQSKNKNKNKNLFGNKLSLASLFKFSLKNVSKHNSSSAPSKQGKGIFSSLKTKIIVMAALFAIIPLLTINIISSNISKRALHNTSTQLTEQLVVQLATNVSSFVNEVERSLTTFAVVEMSQKNLIQNYVLGDVAAKVTAHRDITQSMTYTSTLDANVDIICVLIGDGKVLGESNHFNQSVVSYLEQVELPRSSNWIQGEGDNKNSLYVVREISIRGYDVSPRVVFKVNTTPLMDIMGSVSLLENSTVYLSDSLGSLIYTPDEEVTTLDPTFLNFMVEGVAFKTDLVNKELLTYYTLDNTWTIFTEIPEASLTSQLKGAEITMWALVGVVVVLVLIIGNFVGGSVANPVIKLMNLMKQAEEGDLRVSIVPNGKDEIANLCISFNHMMENMRKLLNETQEVIIATLSDSQVLSASTAQSVETFDQFAISISEIAQGSTDQAIDAQEGSTAMLSLSSSIQDITHSTQMIIKNNEGAKTMIQNANESMDLLNTTTKSSIEMVGNIQTSIIELSSLNKTIESIMKLVENISEQTNLLALNASIEAARAGEVGKGFAVVAHEVRNLAEQSKQSTVNVRSTLNAIEKKTNTTVELAKRSSEIFAKQEKAVKQTSEVFMSIVDLLHGMTDQLTGVNAKALSMEEIKEQTMEKISNIATVAQEAAASTQEASALSEEQKELIGKLSDLADKLSDSMNGLNASIQTFKIK